MGAPGFGCQFLTKCISFIAIMCARVSRQPRLSTPVASISVRPDPVLAAAQRTALRRVHEGEPTSAWRESVAESGEGRARDSENREGLDMNSFRITRTIVSPALVLASLALALPLASQAAGSTRQTEPGTPLATTGTVGRVTGTTAVLEGSVDPRTYTTTYYFQYGPTSAYGQQTATGTLPGGSTATAMVKISGTAAGFLPGYHYRLVASNEKSTAGPTFGRDRTYTLKTTRKKSEFVLPKTFPATPLGGTFVLAGTLTGTGSANRASCCSRAPTPTRRRTRTSADRSSQAPPAPSRSTSRTSRRAPSSAWPPSRRRPSSASSCRSR